MSKNKVIVLSLTPLELERLKDLRAHYGEKSLKGAVDRALLAAWREHCEAPTQIAFDFDQDRTASKPKPRRRHAEIVSTGQAPMTAADRVRARGSLRRAQVVETGEVTSPTDGLSRR